LPISQPSQQQLKTYLSVNVSRRGFLRHWIGLGLVVLGPALVSAEEGTRGMKRRHDRRDDRGERVQKRDDNFKERRDDPIGVRGPERRNDRRDVKDDRRKDRRERVL
jgi:hypothetical protein